jgi:hypothetical protein
MIKVYLSKKAYTGCFKIGEFRIQSVVGKGPVELVNTYKKKIALTEEDIPKHFNFVELKKFLLQSKAICQKIVLGYYFPQSSAP